MTAHNPAEHARQMKALSLIGLHEAFVASQPAGRRLVMKSADVAGANFSGADLRQANLADCNLEAATLTGARC